MKPNPSLPIIDARELAIQPIERSETIPSLWYTDPQFYSLDMENIFARTWQCVGHVSRVLRPGDFLTATVAENPVIVVRGKDNRLRAFFNVCRHRGGPLAMDEQGSCNALQCKYHGWTYLLDGSLRGVPQFDRVELFDRKDFGLVPIALEIWDGLMFVNLHNDTALAPTPSAILKDITGKIAPVSLANRVFHSRVNYDLECNWKVYVDNYLEGYHLPYVHPELCNLLDYQKYVTETFDHYSLQYSPFTGNDATYGAGDGEALYYFIFPNLMLNILPGRLQTNVVLPTSPLTTRVIFDYYYDDVSSPEALKRIHDDLSYSDRVQEEDREICEHVQRGLQSRAYDRGRFSVEMEQGVYHFQSLLKKAYGN